MHRDEKSGGSGLGLAAVFAVVFIVLKLTGLIEWSWVWVLCPIWISVLLDAVIVLIAFIAAWISERK